MKKSVTRLLAERKALEARIRTANGQPFIAIQKGTGGDKPVGYIGKSVADINTLGTPAPGCTALTAEVGAATASNHLV